MEITFEKGEPVALNGETMEPVALIQKLNELGAAFAVGREDTQREVLAEGIVRAHEEIAALEIFTGRERQATLREEAAALEPGAPALL